MSASVRRIAWVALLPVLAFAGWRAFTLGAADDLAITEPAFALSWRPAHPRATFEAAQAAGVPRPASESYGTALAIR